MSISPLEKRPSGDSQNVDLKSRYLKTLKRGKLQVMRAMARLTATLMDIEEVIADNELHLADADSRELKRIRLSNERGIEKPTVLATQVERCENKSTTYKEINRVPRVTTTNIQTQNGTKSRKRPRDENDNFDDTKESYEIIMRNKFSGKREKILSSFDCRNLLEALISTRTIENGKLTSYNDTDIDSGRCDTIGETDTPKAKHFAPNYSNIRSDEPHAKSNAQKQKQGTKTLNTDNSKDKTAQKRPIEATKEKTEKHKGLSYKQTPKSGGGNSGNTVKRKSSEAATTKQTKEENIPESIIAANNSVFKEIMDQKQSKKEPDMASVLSETTKQLYEILAGN